MTGRSEASQKPSGWEDIVVGIKNDYSSAIIKLTAVQGESSKYPPISLLTILEGEQNSTIF